MFNTPAKYLESYAGYGEILVHREDLEEWAKLSALQPEPVSETLTEAIRLCELELRQAAWHATLSEVETKEKLTRYFGPLCKSPVSVPLPDGEGEWEIVTRTRVKVFPSPFALGALRYVEKPGDEWQTPQPGQWVRCSPTALPPAPAEPESVCGCWECSSKEIRRSRMIVCSICGNKRCPRATYHGNACSGSNEPGQAGSRFTGNPIQDHAVEVTPAASEELPQPDFTKRLDHQIRMHPFSSYTYAAGDERLNEIAREFFRHFEELWKLKKDEAKTHKVFDLLSVPQCKTESDSNLRLSDRAVCLASRTEKPAPPAATPDLARDKFHGLPSLPGIPCKDAVQKIQWLASESLGRVFGGKDDLELAFIVQSAIDAATEELQAVADANYQKWQEWRKKAGDHENAWRQVRQQLDLERAATGELRAKLEAIEAILNTHPINDLKSVKDALSILHKGTTTDAP